MGEEGSGVEADAEAAAIAAESAASTLSQRVRDYSTVNRYGLLLLLLIVTYAVAVASSPKHLGTGTLILIQLVAVWLVFSVSDSTRIRRIAAIALIVAGFLSFGGTTIGITTDSVVLLDALYAVNILLYAIAPIVVLRHVMARKEVDLQTLLASICAYLLIGMAFAFSYRFMASVQPGSFFGEGGDGSVSDDFFFSFITLTTTGYGNLVPQGQVGQSMAVLEAIIGQFFLAGVVAKIVTSWRPRGAMKDQQG